MRKGSRTFPAHTGLCETTSAGMADSCVAETQPIPHADCYHRTGTASLGKPTRMHETSLAIETSFQRTGMPTIQTGRRNDLLKLDVVDLHRVQALCASKVDLVVKGPLFPTFALISGISMWTRVMKLKFSIDEIKVGHGGCSRSRASLAMIARLFLYRRILISSSWTDAFSRK